MEYAAMTVWLLVIVFSALGVHWLWSSLIQPKVVNSVLLPGTLVAQLGHVLGLLITGGTVDNTALIKDDDSGEPQTGQDPKPKVPLVGPIVVALLPMLGCAAVLYWASQSPRLAGAKILAGMAETSLNRFEDFSMPTSLALFFAAAHNLLNMVERLVSVIRESDLGDWRTLVFLYLVVCLTVRMAPLTGNLRGSLGAIFVGGIVAFLVSKVFSSPEKQDPLGTAWPVMSFCVAVLILLLIISLLVKGTATLVKTLFGKG